MKRVVSLLFTAAIISCSSNTDHVSVAGTPAQPCTHTNKNQYTWLTGYDRSQSLCERFAPPTGFSRVKVDDGSFGDWLRHLPLKPSGSDVHLYSGKLKGRQDVHAAVIDMDAGDKDLQQCADAVMRLRGEYLYSVKNYEALHFNYTSGDLIGFKKWSEGYRPVVNGNKVSWVQRSQPGTGRETFRAYMDNIFTYSGTISLKKEMTPVSDVKSIEPGDVFVLAGSPGHAMIVLDVAENPETKERMFMLAQSYMPAQEMHIVKNFNDDKLNPWYSASFSGDLDTPEWTFGKNDLRRFVKEK